MFIKMGFKTWTRGEQIGIRVYTPSIRKLTEILTLPSNDKRYKTLEEFIKVVEKSKKRREFLLIHEKLRFVLII